MSEIPEGYRLLVAIILAIFIPFAISGSIRDVLNIVTEFFSNIIPG